MRSQLQTRKHLASLSALAFVIAGSLMVTGLAAQTAGGAGSTGREQQVEEGKLESKEWFEDGAEGQNHEAHEVEEILETEAWEGYSDGTKEEYFDWWQEEMRESGASGTEGAREGRIEWMRENKEDQDGPPKQVELLPQG